jgi:tripartite-type tricarboxylate transporter receptor subunit TctC
MTKTTLLHVPYKGGGPAMIDLLAGNVQLMFASTPSVGANVSSGRLRALAVSTARRSKLYPNVPTISESGLPGFEAHSWYGFVVPAKTPQAIVSRLNREIVQILERAEVSETASQAGAGDVDQHARSVRRLHQVRIRQVGENHSRGRDNRELDNTSSPHRRGSIFALMTMVSRRRGNDDRLMQT